jgi:alpha/beta superfamily hydrolase
LPYVLAGFSFGARVTTRLGAALGDSKHLIALGFPTRMGDAGYLVTCYTPKTFLQSTHDQYGPQADLEQMFDSFAQPKRLVWIEAQDHFFAGALDQLEEQVRLIEL